MHLSQFYPPPPPTHTHTLPSVCTSHQALVKNCTYSFHRPRPSNHWNSCRCRPRDGRFLRACRNIGTGTQTRTCRQGILKKRKCSDASIQHNTAITLSAMKYSGWICWSSIRVCYTIQGILCTEGILKTVPGYHTTLTCMVDCTHLVIVTCTHPCDQTLRSPLWFYLVLTFVVVPCTHPCDCTFYSPLWLYLYSLLWLYLVLTLVIVPCTHPCDCILYSLLWLYLVVTLVIVPCDCTLYSLLWLYLVLTFVIVPCSHPCDCTLYSLLWLYLVLTLVIVPCSHPCGCTL